jgi:Methyltransferase domain
MKLDLGCGTHKREGFTGVDISSACSADVVHDLRIRPWPFADQSVEEVHCAHFFEHLNGMERVAFMEEMYRVMKVGSVARMITPYWTSMDAVQDPTHQWPPIAETSYNYFSKAWRDLAGLQHYGIHCDFALDFQFHLHPDMQGRSPKEQQFAARFYVNVVKELIAILTRR